MAATGERMSQSEQSDAYTLRTLVRGAAVLDLLSTHDHLTLKMASERLGLDTTVTYRILRTWMTTGYLDYDPSTKRYYAGLHLLRLAGKAYGGTGLTEIEARLRIASAATGQTASFSVLTGRHVLYLARVIANRALMYQVEVGKTLPAYATSAGQVQLAFLSREELLELYPDPVLMGYTEDTPKTRDELLAALEDVRRDGHAVNHGQLSASVSAVAVPVRDKQGKVVGAFSVAGPSAEFSSDEIYRRYLPVLLEAAQSPIELTGWVP